MSTSGKEAIEGIMSKFKIMKMGREGISPNMVLLHLRWQQIRLELLQQAALPTNHNENGQNSHLSEKKEFIAA